MHLTSSTGGMGRMVAAALGSLLVCVACGDGPTGPRGGGSAEARLERDGVRVEIVRGDEVLETAAYDVGDQGPVRHVGVFLSRSAGDSLALAEVEILDATGNNVALGKTAIHPSSEDGSGPDQANDGDPTTTSVTRDSTLWWYVDLERDHDISSIVVTVPADGCCEAALDQIRVATSHDGFESDRARIDFVDTTDLDEAEASASAPPVHGSVQSDSATAKCDESDADSTSTDPKGFTCELDQKVKFQGLASGTIYYKCTDTAGGFSDFFYTSDVSQDVSKSLTCWTGTFHLCIELLDSGYDECSMFCSNLTCNTHSVKISEIECEWGY